MRGTDSYIESRARGSVRTESRKSAWKCSIRGSAEGKGVWMSSIDPIAMVNCPLTGGTLTVC